METAISQPVLNTLPQLPVMYELDAEPSSPELEKAIDLLASRKAPDMDGIPAELLEYGKPHLLPST